MADQKQTTDAGNVTFLTQLIESGKLARDPSQVPYARDLVQEFVGQVLDHSQVVSSDTVAFINQRIQEIDTLLTDQLNQIIHNPSFQKLEGSWCGLNYFVMNTNTGTELKLRLLDVTKKEFLDDLEKAVEFDQSQLFKKVYEEEYGTFGGHPYSCLVGDYEFSALPQDMELLEKISHVSAAAFAPFITAACPAMFNLDSFGQLGAPRDLAKIFESAEYVKWQSFR